MVGGNFLSSRLCDDGRLVPSEVLSQFAEFKGDLNQPLESILSIPHQLLIGCFRLEVSLNVHPDSSALTSGTRQPPDDTGPILESHDLSLVLADTSINRVGIVKVVGFSDLEVGASGFGLVLGADERTSADRLLEIVDEFLSSSGLDFLEVVTGEE